MAENRARHAFGNLSDVQKALSEGKIDAFDILFLDGDTEPKIGWIDRNGTFRLVESAADFSELEEIIATKANASDVEALEGQMAEKANTVDVEAKIDQASLAANDYTNKMIEAAMEEHLTKKYEVKDVPVGTLVDYRESEIRIMAPNSVTWTKQNVGEGGDANCYYMTLRTYAPEGATGYKEHLGSQVDAEILVDLKVDEYGRKYQPTWLALAKYDDSTDTWTYYGAKSEISHYIGWDYQIDWYDTDGMMISSDCIRINLSNENCHYTAEPYYVSEVKTEIKTIIEEKIAEANSVYEIVEF